MLTNHKPLIGGTDEGIWRRIHLIPWDVVIADSERDEELGGKLALELDAVLAWLVQGHASWRAKGLTPPARVTEATDTYKSESDALGRFLEQRCLLYPDFRVRSAELFAAWSKWCAAEGEDHGTQTAFTLTLKKLGYDTVRDKGGAKWRGISLAAEPDETGGDGFDGSTASLPARVGGQPDRPSHPSPARRQKPLTSEPDALTVSDAPPGRGWPEGTIGAGLTDHGEDQP
jgi:phage/plasmid-associated DNA primase